MLYLGTSPYEPAVADLLDRRRIGLISQPDSNPPRAGWIWAADNGCFADTWDAGRWQAWLAKDWPRAGCLFAVVPDALCDPVLTRRRFHTWAPVVRGLRYPVAFVAQDGCERAGLIPWGDFDCLFVGGSTAWKLSEHARRIADQAHERGLWVHVGRINSGRRYRSWFTHAQSCDGSFLSVAPAANIPRLLRWLDRSDRETRLAL